MKLDKELALNNEIFMDKAIEFSMMQDLGGPFGAVIVKDNVIIGVGRNEVLATNDPTAHAEIVAIRDACKKIKSFDLLGCVLYTSCEPCPMCLAATYWAGIQVIYYGCTRGDAANISFGDEWIYEQINLPIEKRPTTMIQLSHDKALEAFCKWNSNPNRIMY